MALQQRRIVAPADRAGAVAKWNPIGSIDVTHKIGR